MEASLRPEVVGRPLERVALDITEMPMSARGNRYVLVVMDYFTKYVWTYALPNQTAEAVADCLVDLVLDQGVPERLHSDQGRQFESQVFGKLCQRLGISKTRTSPYNPQSDGMVERFNRTLKDMVSKYISPSGSNWDQHLKTLSFAYLQHFRTQYHWVLSLLPHARTGGALTDRCSPAPEGKACPCRQFRGQCGPTNKGRI